MDQIDARLENIIDVWVKSDGSIVKLLCALDGQRQIDLTLIPQHLLNLLLALHFADQQAEEARDKTSAQGHAIPHPFLGVHTTEPIEVFQPDQVGVRVTLQNNSRLDFVLPTTVAQALRDQLDACLTAAQQQPSQKALTIFIHHLLTCSSASLKVRSPGGHRLR
jgi:hypothetical protein